MDNPKFTEEGSEGIVEATIPGKPRQFSTIQHRKRSITNLASRTKLLQGLPKRTSVPVYCSSTLMAEKSVCTL